MRLTGLKSRHLAGHREIDLASYIYTKAITLSVPDPVVITLSVPVDIAIDIEEGGGGFGALFNGSASFSASLIAVSTNDLTFAGTSGFTADVLAVAAFEVAFAGTSGFAADISSLVTSGFTFAGGSEFAADFSVLATFALGFVGAADMSASVIGLAPFDVVFESSATLSADIVDQPANWTSVGLMTDLDSDIDDVVAEALLFDMLSEVSMPLSYVSVASRSNTAAHCQRVLLDQARRSSVPVGQMLTPPTANSSTLYNGAVANLKLPVLNRTDYPDSVVVMRTALAAMPNKSHKIVTIGNLTDYAALLQSPADGISPLTGIELVAAKVISVHSMGGYYPNTATTEANVNGDTPSANYAAANTPVPIFWAPYALGNDVLTRIPTAGFVAETDAYVVAWNAYGTTTRQSWDAIPILHAMLGLNGWFTDLGAHDVNFTSGSTWTPNAAGRNYPLGRSTTATILRDYINGRVDAFMDDYGIKPTPAAPVFTANPAATGTASAGSTVSVNNGSVTGFPAPTFTYQWRCNGTAISGATSSTYTVGSFTSGDLIDCLVTATNSQGSASADSNDLTFGGTPAYSPASLFTGSEQGYWIDPSDFSTMFQDIAGTVPVTAVGQLVGRILDKSGKGNHFVAPADANRPTLQVDANGKHYISGGRLNTVSVINAGTDKFQVVAGVKAGPGTSTGFVCEFSPVTDTNDGSFFLSAPHAGATNYGLRVRGTILTPTAQTASFTASETVLLTARADLTTDIRDIRRNGVAVGGGSSDCGTGNFGNYQMFLMARSGGTVAFNGRIYQKVCRFGAPLDTTSLTELEAFVNARTGAF